MNVQQLIEERRLLEGRLTDIVRRELDDFKESTGVSISKVDVYLLRLGVIGVPLDTYQVMQVKTAFALE